MSEQVYSEPPAIVVERDADGKLTGLKCPACGGSSVHEIDHGTRWNSVHVTDGGGLDIATGVGDFEHSSWRCGAIDQCGVTLSEPDDLRDEIEAAEFY